ncbi:Clotting factor B like protein [Argiope bruennichi]|uniref:Clotting factor B like protein n=1 Tax=Argiope bruennichi TaxID=94029 RepID=A0A8T0FCM1_ARGBR|nr:Clotting factor B like protein [Argiope bruennichi]
MVQRWSAVHFRQMAPLTGALKTRKQDPSSFPGKRQFHLKLTTLRTEDDVDSIGVDIVFPADGSVRKEYTFKPIGISTKGPPTSGPSPVTPTSAQTVFQRPCKPSENKPKRFNPALERNPEEKEFEIIPIPKITTTKVPILKSSETPMNFHTPEIRTSVTIHSTTTKIKVEQPELTTVHSIGRTTDSLFEIAVATESAEISTCGNTATSPNIAGGTESKPHQWPWMAAIFQRFTTARPNKFLCGGSLINTRYVLTAAHCCVSGPSTVALPASSFWCAWGPLQKMAFNDIALMRLTTDLPSYTNRIAPVCLPYPTLVEDDLVDRMATVVGWGSMYLGGEHQDQLHEVSIPIVSTDDCALAYSRIKSAAFLARGSTHVLCAGLKEGGKDSCKVRIQAF